jgi:hypothetical protein
MNKLEAAAWSTLSVSIHGVVHASQQATDLATVELGTVRWRGPRLGRAAASVTFEAHAIIILNPEGVHYTLGSGVLLKDAPGGSNLRHRRRARILEILDRKLGWTATSNAMTSSDMGPSCVGWERVLLSVDRGGSGLEGISTVMKCCGVAGSAIGAACC